MALRPKTHDREIRGAAADVGDQGHFLAADRPFIVQRRGDRLELEGDLVETDLAGDLAQGLLGLAIGVRRVIDEVHRPAMHHMAQFATGGLFGASFQPRRGYQAITSRKRIRSRPSRVVSSISEVPSTDLRLRISRPGAPST